MPLLPSRREGRFARDIDETSRLHHLLRSPAVVLGADEAEGGAAHGGVGMEEEDLEEGLYLNHDAGWINLGANCVVEIDDFSKLTQRKYTLVTFVGSGAKDLRGSAPRLADDAPTDWRLRLSANKKTLRLVRNEGTILLLR